MDGYRWEQWQGLKSSCLDRQYILPFIGNSLRLKIAGFPLQYLSIDILSMIPLGLVNSAHVVVAPWNQKGSTMEASADCIALHFQNT